MISEKLHFSSDLRFPKTHFPGITLPSSPPGDFGMNQSSVFLVLSLDFLVAAVTFGIGIFPPFLSLPQT